MILRGASSLAVGLCGAPPAKKSHISTPRHYKHLYCNKKKNLNKEFKSIIRQYIFLNNVTIYYYPYDLYLF